MSKFVEIVSPFLTKTRRQNFLHVLALYPKLIDSYRDSAPEPLAHVFEGPVLHAADEHQKAQYQLLDLKVMSVLPKVFGDRIRARFPEISQTASYNGLSREYDLCRVHFGPEKPGRV